MGTTATPAGGPLADRLQKVSAELHALNEAIKAGNIDGRILREFREAVDHIRLTAWSVQQWLDLQAKRGDVYSVLSLLTTERIRRATQLSGDLSLDLDAAEVTFETEGLDKLYVAVEGLFVRLARLFKK